MTRLFPYVLPAYALVGLAVVFASLWSSNWDWSTALASGLRESVYGVLVTGLAITSACGHLFFGDVVARSLGHEPNDASRLFQRELGFFTAVVAAVSLLVSGSGAEALGLAWGGFLICAGINHVLKGSRRLIALSDGIIGGVLLGVSLS